MPMSYLDKIAEDKEYKVVIYADHRRDFVRHFNILSDALKYYHGMINHRSNGDFTAGIALIKTDTGEPIYRQTWRV